MERRCVVSGADRAARLEMIFEEEAASSPAPAEGQQNKAGLKLKINTLHSETNLTLHMLI